MYTYFHLPLTYYCVLVRPSSADRSPSPLINCLDVVRHIMQCISHTTRYENDGTPSWWTPWTRLRDTHNKVSVLVSASVLLEPLDPLAWPEFRFASMLVYQWFFCEAIHESDITHATWRELEKEPLFIDILDKTFRDDEFANADIACS